MGSSSRATLHQTKLAIMKRLLILLGPMLVLVLSSQQPAVAILNCFPSSMFKLNKGGYQNSMYPGAERTSWYSNGMYSPPLPQSMGYGSFYSGSPMKMWMQNKWKGGGLFGHKPRNSWKTGGGYLGTLQRPPYSYPQTSYPLFSPLGGGYQFSEQLSSSPYSTGGWSTPVSSLTNKGSLIQQAPIMVYDAISPIKQQPLLYTNSDYSSTKGGTNARLTNKNIYQTTGGYDNFDSISVALMNNKNMSSYSYPDWYTGVVESPAKIAQQLLKSRNIKSQRLRTMSQSPSSLAFIKPSNQFNILDEPRFNGYGKVESLTAQEARLSCSFNEAINQSNKPLWIKFVGPYNSSSSQDSKLVPAFNCLDTQCRTKEIESSQDYRYSFDHGPATTTLIISEPKLSDYGVYRCSALTKALNNSPLETIYQIVQLTSSS